RCWLSRKSKRWCQYTRRTCSRLVRWCRDRAASHGGYNFLVVGAILVCAVVLWTIGKNDCDRLVFTISRYSSQLLAEFSQVWWGVRKDISIPLPSPKRIHPCRSSRV